VLDRFRKVVGREGFEPAQADRKAATTTMPRLRLTAVKRRCLIVSEKWWAVKDSNLRPKD
jgi:hypothetical protein